ncbi:ferritin [Keratinibaculum paraultunense]|uniref:Ferritin n=1 Tax=Keratinibaculum paraultunense TaxID=1278232 RepID=A0A4R3KPK8_9FIRM|nr:ferritin [Keratinibaculum paraultunense]QQY79353.1 ferritin [Keratinibaculum paraultunense]TCS86628.1 ferritin [Keratinibaculum paraultunense]
MASEKLLKELNDQFNFELESGYIYMAMASYCAEQNLDGFANFFIVQAQEEYVHAMKFFDFINDLDGRVTMKGIKEPLNEYESLVHVFETALNHEKLVTSRINKLVDLAKEENDYTTISFLQWFVDEQLEEENSMKDILIKLDRMGDNFQGIYMLDKKLGERTLE